MDSSGKKIARVLLNADLLTDELLVKAQDQQNKSGRGLTEILIAQGVNADGIRQALATHLKVPEIGLQNHTMDTELVELIPKSWVVKNGIIPLERVQNILTLGMVNPFDVEVVNDIRFKTGLNVRVAVISEAELPGVIERCYGMSAQVAEVDLDEVLSDITTEEIEILAQTNMEEEEEDEFPDDLESEAPVIRLVDCVIQDAVKARATDIHIEPAQSNVHVRFRIDGVLRDILQVPKYFQGPLLSRVKVMGSMDISDKRKPQDGRSKIKMGKRVVDLRISSLPTMFGEKIVLRLLEQKKGVISVGDIGFSPHLVQSIGQLTQHPQGMILVTGPTGSGKTTTLISLLSRLNDGTTNIVTVEDPVEYQVPGINQVQINIKAGMTFASVLRSILRQDPDVVLVGEMRDHETAEIAFHAAQTGHLVLSTLHTNDAASTVTRLLSMGIDPYLIASSVLGVLAQRLVRQLCPECKVPVSLDQKLAQWVPKDTKDKPHQVFAPKGCKRCRDSGYYGRFPLAEILMPNDTIRDLILKGMADREILNVARKGGMKTIFEDGIDRVLQGLTTFDEVARVVAPPRAPSEEGKTIVEEQVRMKKALVVEDQRQRLSPFVSQYPSAHRLSRLPYALFSGSHRAAIRRLCRRRDS